jgi:peptidoglycan/xylan/chitin deacetylase (PgdA/CDA1 family)
VQGIFTISLDFELHWGVFDKMDRLTRIDRYQNTLQLIPHLLELFSKYEVHATWATVGGLFAKDQQEWEKLKPTIEPDYLNEKYSAYKWARIHGLGQAYHWAHFAPNTINKILQYPGQELGTHTFSHYYCLEPQNERKAFSEDLDAAKRAALKFRTEPVSLVFPRNQFNPEYLQLCYQKGIKIVRSNPRDWFWSPIPENGSNIIRKIFRTGDGYVKIGNRTSYPLTGVTLIPNEPIQLPASRLFRSWHPKYKFANKMRLRRTIEELQTAASAKECYHLWWHPENFGDYPKENMEDLNILLGEYVKAKNRFGMTSWNMGEYVRHLS